MPDPTYSVRLGWHATDIDADGHLPAEILSAAETDTTKVLAPDGAGGVTFRAGSGSGSVPWSYAQADGGLVGDGTTDDTAAFQAWITSVTASGTKSGWFFFEPGTYLIGGALQDTGAFNGQILLPAVSTASAQITLRFQGAARPPLAVHGPIPTPGGYSIIKSSLTGASGSAAAISGGNSLNNIEVIVEDLICFAPGDPTFTFWNLSKTQGGKVDGVYVSTTTDWVGTRTQPTHSNAYGVRLPQEAQSNYTYVDGLCVCGFYTGIQHGELTIARGYVCAFDIVAVELGDSKHASLIVDMEQTACQIGIHVAGLHYADVLQYDAEHVGSPSWAVTTYDLNDPSNLLKGAIRWWGVLAGSGPDNSFTINGGSHVTASELGTAPTAAFATPSITYGTPAAGSAATAVRSDATIAKPTEADLSTSDVTTGNVSTSKHGYAPKAPNDATKYLDGTGAYSTPPGSATHAELLTDGALGFITTATDYIYVTGVPN